MPGFNASESPSETNGTLEISPLLGPYASIIIRYVFGIALVIIFGVLGIFFNMANICVYLKMGIKETTNTKFFALSVFDLLVCMSAVVSQVNNIPNVSQAKMPSGAPWFEVSFVAIYVAYPCLGCSAWVTAVLSVERYLCIATPLKVKDILTPRRTRALILVMVAYEFVFLVLFLFNPGPPYGKWDRRRVLYFYCSFSAPTFISFFIVSISTILLIIRLKRSFEWRNESSVHSGRGSANTKEKKVTKSVLAICIIFIACYSLNIGVFFVTTLNPDFEPRDPYLGTLFNAVYSFSILFQALCAAVNILVYYSMSTKYREVFNSMFCRRSNENE